MLGALGGLSVVALILNRKEFRPSVVLTYLLAAFIMWLHVHGWALA